MDESNSGSEEDSPVKLKEKKDKNEYNRKEGERNTFFHKQTELNKALL